MAADLLRCLLSGRVPWQVRAVCAGKGSNGMCCLHAAMFVCLMAVLERCNGMCSVLRAAVFHDTVHRGCALALMPVRTVHFAGGGCLGLGNGKWFTGCLHAGVMCASWLASPLKLLGGLINEGTSASLPFDSALSGLALMKLLLVHGPSIRDPPVHGPTSYWTGSRHLTH